jgi:hypothetical protein
MAGDVCGLPQFPDLGKYFDRIDEMFKTAEGLILLLLIVVIIGGVLWIVGNLVGRKRR